MIELDVKNVLENVKKTDPTSGMILDIVIKGLMEKCNRYEEALDTASEMLARYTLYRSKKEWKEFLMEDDE